MRHRKQLFVDPKVQGALLLRAIGYWFFCLLTMALTLLLWQLFTGPARLFYLHFDDMLYWYGPAAVASLLVLPLVIIDCVRLSNRFAGPLYRLRREMRRLGAGETVKPIHFRDGDFWLEFADEFNAVAKRVEQLNKQIEELQQGSPIPFESDPELQSVANATESEIDLQLQTAASTS
jgi:hypothetical protein